MTAKTIAVYLISLYFVTLCAFGSCNSQFTEAQLNAFKGLNPCENKQRMQAICDKLAKPPGSTANCIGGPQCGPLNVSLAPVCGKATEVERLALVCQYKPNDTHPKAFIMGQAPNHVMRCEFGNEYANLCYPTQDVPFS